MQLNRIYVVNVCFKRTQEYSEEGEKHLQIWLSSYHDISLCHVKGSNWLFLHRQIIVALTIFFFFLESAAAEKLGDSQKVK
jgi:hypothetical protein